MDKTKRDRLLRIDDEVGELHPLLNSLFERMPAIKHFEYTHGNQELGADFVLSTDHETLGGRVFIGVIAKTGKITQDFTDIDRQIDECAMPRTFMNGREKIRLSEVWVITTKSITHSAKEKIEFKYKNKSIFFIDGKDLHQLIDQYIPYFWNELEPTIAEYLDTIRRRNEEADVALSLILVDSKPFYIEQDVFERPKASFRDKKVKPRRVQLDSILENEKGALVEGGMGGGKSKLLRRAVQHLTEPSVFLARKTIPVVATFSEFVDRHRGDIAALMRASVPANVAANHPDAKYLVLMDGVDEKNIPPEEQLSSLRLVADQAVASKNVRIVMFSRHLEGLEDATEAETKLARFELRPLSLNRMLEFIKTACRQLDVTGRLVEDLKKSQLFKQLPHSPIAAILLAKLLNENPKDLPSSMTELFSQYVELILGRWEIDKGLRTQAEYQVMDRVLTEMARRMLDCQTPALSHGDTRGILDTYLRDRKLEVSAETIMEKIEHRCEIVFYDPQRETFSFKHRSFAEFLYGKDCVRVGGPELCARAFNFYWMNAVFFYIGRLRDCPEVLDKIRTMRPANEMERWLKLINMSNYLLAGYASPYEVVERTIREVVVDASKLFKELVETRPDSPFVEVPRMVLLYLMQMFIREGYAYHYFKSAIEAAALEIAAGDEPSEIKAYSLFFLSVAYIEMGEGGAFNFLLEDSGITLPLDIQLAIGHEAQNLKVHSHLVKKQTKFLRKSMRDNPKLRRSVDALYSTPLRKLSPPNP